MQELMSRHKAYALSPRDCLKTTLFQKWQKMVAPPGQLARATLGSFFFGIQGIEETQRLPEVSRNDPLSASIVLFALFLVLAFMPWHVDRMCVWMCEFF